jgi:hypothetical protein
MPAAIEKEGMFFFEKKNQKTFGRWRGGPGERTRQRAKVFCFFSSEKKTFVHLTARMPMPGNFVQSRNQQQANHDGRRGQHTDSLQRIMKHPGNDGVYHKPPASRSSAYR